MTSVCSMKDFFKVFLDKIKKDDLKYLTSATAYFFIISLVPFLIVLINLVSMFVASQLDSVFKMIDLLPSETGGSLKPIITKIIEQSSSTLLSVGLIVALWSASNAINSLIFALNKAFDVTGDKNFFKSRFKALIFTVLIVLMIITVLIFMVFGNSIISLITNSFKIKLTSEVLAIIGLIQYLIPIFGMILGFCLLFKYAPDFKKGESIHFKTALISGALASVGWIIITLLYSFYVSNMSNMSNTYGGLVGVFALFIWFNLSCKIIILAAEFGYVYEKYLYCTKI